MAYSYNNRRGNYQRSGGRSTSNRSSGRSQKATGFYVGIDHSDPERPKIKVAFQNGQIYSYGTDQFTANYLEQNYNPNQEITIYKSNQDNLWRIPQTFTDRQARAGGTPAPQRRQPVPQGGAAPTPTPSTPASKADPDLLAVFTAAAIAYTTEGLEPQQIVHALAILKDQQPALYEALAAILRGNIKNLTPQQLSALLYGMTQGDLVDFHEIFQAGPELEAISPEPFMPDENTQ